MKDLLKNKNKMILVFVIAIIISVFMTNIYAASQEPILVNKINLALKKIQGYLVKISAPAAGVAIASGVLIRKLSFGSEEKMVIGRKIIINAIVGYAIIISIDIIIKFINTLI
ncbi:MAG: hypothetical protein RSB67_03155 [Clostridia bacterium]